MIRTTSPLRAAAAASAWRYRELDAQIGARRDSLWRQLALRRGDSVDASLHVSRVVDANEGTFDRLVLLGTARRIALLISVGCTLGAVVAALALRTTRAAGQTA